MKNQIDIHQFLPHRKPMLMVDYILELDPEKVETSFEITSENIFIENNKLSAFGLIEHAAQTCSSILGQEHFQDQNTDKTVLGFITNIKKIQLFETPLVGDKIISKANLISKYGNICHVSCNTYKEEILLLSIEITLVIEPVTS